MILILLNDADKKMLHNQTTEQTKKQTNKHKLIV